MLVLARFQSLLLRPAAAALSLCRLPTSASTSRFRVTALHADSFDDTVRRNSRGDTFNSEDTPFTSAVLAQSKYDYGYFCSIR